MEQQRFEMCVGVIFSSLMMAVVRVGWRQFFEPFFDVVDQAALVIIDVNCRGDMHRRHEAEAVGDAAAGDNFFHLPGDVDQFAALARGRVQFLMA